MSAFKWAKNPADVMNVYERRNTSATVGEVTALIQWSAWGVESLHYLADLHKHLFSKSSKQVLGHSIYVVEIAHVRWATGTALTSIDLAAAALGRAFCRQKGEFELSIRHFSINGLNKAKNEKAKRRIGQLPPSLQTWVNSVQKDHGHELILKTRNALTHAKLSRSFTNDASAVTQFEVLRSSPETYREYKQLLKLNTAQGLIELARDFTTKHIVELLRLIDKI